MGNKEHIAENIIVALDFDGCIALGHAVKIMLAKEMYGIDIGPSETEKESFPQVEGVKDAYKKMMKVIMKEFTKDFQLAPGCKEVLDALYAQGFRFVVVTSRDDEELKAAWNFVKKHQLQIDYRHCTKEGTKEEFINRLHARAMIDDTYEKLLPLEETTLASLYFLRQPWNINRKVPKDSRVTSVKSWTEFHDQLIIIKQLHEAVCYALKIDNSWAQIRKIQLFILQNQCKAMEYYKSYRRKEAA